MTGSDHEHGFGRAAAADVRDRVEVVDARHDLDAGAEVVWCPRRRARSGPSSCVRAAQPRREIDARRGAAVGRARVVLPHLRRRVGLDEVRPLEHLAAAGVDERVPHRVRRGAVGHAPRQAASAERERGGRPVGVAGRLRGARRAARARERAVDARRRPGRRGRPRPRSAPASCPRSSSDAGEPRTESTRPSRVTLTRSSWSAAGMPSTAWRQRSGRRRRPSVVVGRRLAACRAVLRVQAERSGSGGSRT